MPAAIYQSLRTEKKILESILSSNNRASRYGRVNEARLFSTMANQSLEKLTALIRLGGPLPVEFAADLEALSRKVRELAVPPIQPLEQIVA